jgi:hypothetical protein
MFIAKEKRKTNIGEYLLYMFQIEDLIRACNLDENCINKNLISQYQVDDNQRTEIKNWYLGLIELMIDEKLEQKGHLSFVNNKINEVMEFHQYLLQSSEYINYQNNFKTIIPIIDELKTKQSDNLNDINIILNAIYGIYLLKIKNKEISTDTLKSINKLSLLLNELSIKFKEYEEGKIGIE